MTGGKKLCTPKEVKCNAKAFALQSRQLDEFKTHIHTGDCMNADDAMIMRSMVEKIIVFDDRISIHLRCGMTISQKTMNKDGKNDI